MRKSTLVIMAMVVVIAERLRRWSTRTWLLKRPMPARELRTAFGTFVVACLLVCRLVGLVGSCAREPPLLDAIQLDDGVDSLD